MEDIEDLLAGSGGGGAPPGFRLPINAVGVNPKYNKNKPRLHDNHLSKTGSLSPKIPGTESDSEYMAGQLSAFGYALTDNSEEADIWLINTCTVKSPSQSAMDTLIAKCKSAKKPLVVAGCVPQGSRDLKELEGVSIVGVQQIDRVVEVVEETLKGHEVRLLHRKKLPALDLPKVRRNKFVEILPINVGCLGACTYCKTKHARGHLGSYTVESLVGRVRTVIADGVKEVWLSSEDTGAYGNLKLFFWRCRDIGVNLPILLNAIVAELPPDGSTMLRIGMTNPPFILEHLKEIAEVLRHPCVYSFLHVPVQSGSDAVLSAMNREYTLSDFRTVVDTLIELVPGMQIATDIICGFPGETDEDFNQTVNLIKEYKFPQVHISQFYPRPGTPAARMKKVPSAVVKKRSRELTSVFEAFTPYLGMEGRVERIWITEIAADGIHLVGHTKGYVQVLVPSTGNMLGTSALVKITSVGRWSVFGEVIKILNQVDDKIASNRRISSQVRQDKCSSCSSQNESSACSNEPDPSACGLECCEGKITLEEGQVSWIDRFAEDINSQNVIGWLLRKRKNQLKGVENDVALGSKKKQEWMGGNMGEWGVVDRALLGGMLVSFLIILALLIHVGFRTLSTK
ncbi:threonylcarbamoyladenosine tRNA methylthiotransferase [Citrus sinensis]|uniref:Threonylcarbamoyladenosine tRNA methylthiotransferase n=1 Tax=Citrus sinensis TaxID=2711 RepID=A0ACB8KUR8_CITSI|nr:threonylcarbamoyladenosine tRNA methylthiotransferase [Citrus sinensis]